MLHLTPIDPESIPDLPKRNSDVSREVSEVLDLNGPLNIPRGVITPLRIQTGYFTLNVSINTRTMADRLVVTFHGARGSRKSEHEGRRPMYDRRDWDALFGCPVLAISDPIAELDWDSHLPRVGTFSGTIDNDLVPEIHALINKVCDELGISKNKVVTYGSSSGGSAAILVAANRREGTGAIAVVPFLRPDKYRDEILAINARMSGGTIGDYERMLEEQPMRVHPLTAIRDGIAKGNDVRVVVAQNVRDKVTINKHFAGLWRRFDIDPEGGISPNGRVLAVLFDSKETGHGHEPPEYSVPLVKMAYEFFDTGAIGSAEKPAKKAAQKKETV